jgi:hypothetical protein
MQPIMLRSTRASLMKLAYLLLLSLLPPVQSAATEKMENGTMDTHATLYSTFNLDKCNVIALSVLSIDPNKIRTRIRIAPDKVESYGKYIRVNDRTMQRYLDLFRETQLTEIKNYEFDTRLAFKFRCKDGSEKILYGPSPLYINATDQDFLIGNTTYRTDLQFVPKIRVLLKETIDDQ